MDVLTESVAGSDAEMTPMTPEDITDETLVSNEVEHLQNRYGVILSFVFDAVC